MNAEEKKATAEGAKKVKRTRRTTLFPASSFEEALTIPNAIQKHASGDKVRRLTLFDQMGKSPDSGASRQLIVNSNKYGLTKGNYTAEHLELTPAGKAATSADSSPKDKLTARFKLAISNIPPFKALYEAQKGNRLPAPAVLEDLAKDSGIPAADAKECVEIFIVNAKFLGILKPIAGAERIIPIEQVIEGLSTIQTIVRPASDVEERPEAGVAEQVKTVTTEGDWGNVCFYISPIGDDDSEHRKHADLFLGSIVEPALEEFKLKVVRADKIGKAGMITAQVVEYILKSRSYLKKNLDISS